MEHGQSPDMMETSQSTANSRNTVSKQVDSLLCGPNIDPTSYDENKPNETLSDIKNVLYIYREDVVRYTTDNKTGVVTEVAGDSDSDCSMDDDDDGDGNDDDAVLLEDCDAENSRNLDKSDTLKTDDNVYKQNPLITGQVRVLWIDGSETTVRTNDIKVVDRGFLHGDYVASVSDPTGQIGLVVDVNINVDLLAHDGSVLKDIPSKHLRRVRDFSIGDHVVLGPWLGRIEDVFDNVTVQLDDGSVCKVIKAHPFHLKPLDENLLEHGHFPYYPGQRVKATSSSVFKNSRWLSGLWNANRLEGTVTKVTVGSSLIRWIASAGYGSDCDSTPAEEQSPRNLKLLSCFVHANWQLGDWCLLPSSKESSDAPLNNEFFKLDSHGSAKDEPESKETRDESDGEVTTMAETAGNSKVSLSKTTETSNYGGSAESLNNCSVPASKESVHETWSLRHKKLRKVGIKKDIKARKKVENFERAFLIVNTNTKVDVAWQDGTIKCGLNSTSLIPIDSPGDHDFVVEQYVVEKAADSDDVLDTRRVGVVKTVNAKDRTACVRWLKPVTRAEDPRKFDKEEVVSVYELEGHSDYDYRYGDVVVRLCPVSLPSQMDLSVHSVEDVPSNGPDEPRHETLKHDGRGNMENAPSHDMSTEFSNLSWVGNITGLKDGDIEVTWADGLIATVGPEAIYVVGRDDGESVADGSDASDDAASWETVEDNMDAADNAEKDPEAGGGRPEIEGNNTVAENSGTSGALSIPLAAIGFMTRIASGIFSMGRKHLDPLNTGATPCEEFVSAFKGFDIVRDPSDHFFLGSQGQNNAARKWLRKVQRDWDILQNNLPEDIYVRVYEDRMDLLRAVVVGAYGTPYQDGLFFFDFHLPPEYPDVPPSAHYHSGGWRINPNLYEEGKVCLSLLNTWTGRGNEVWDPSSSSILQVLVSLQGLVLNSKPYFNEAGYDKQVGTSEGEKNSLFYNENAFILNCKTMMFVMRKPPKHFEELITEHFRKRGRYILKACDAYMKGCLIGSLTKDSSASSNSGRSNSVGFKLILAKVVPKLIAALTKVGADCGEFKHLNSTQVQ